MNRGIVKTVVSLFTGAGFSILTSCALDAILPKDCKAIKKLAATSAAFVVTCMIAEKSDEYTDKIVDQIADNVRIEVGKTEDPEVTVE